MLEAFEVIERKKKNKDGNLILDGIKIKKISLKLKEKIEELQNIDCLSFNNCGLQSLENFPDYQRLTRIELMGNNFQTGDLKILLKFPELECLSLGENDINFFQDIALLIQLENIV